MATVVFDLDGTLVDTAADLIAAANACFQSRGFGDLLDPVADSPIAFRGGRAMLTAGFARVEGPGAAEVEEDYPRLLAYYDAAIAVHSRPYPGAWEAVEELMRQGYRTAICTNKPEGLALKLMAELGRADLFPALVGADTMPVRKPDPEPLRESVRRAGGDPAQAILIGDTVTDVDTARAAGVPVVMVGFGPTGDAVRDLAPDAVLDHYAALPELVARLMP
ncbi:HAD-IA family hydrolase [Palleronia caenipelagi]|uniref:phosphoglycolate phosphatase n=1 Tax=Palleronia caenipelagi TaxID=2489174 RepID=A0A547Q523_9RHOB|nr:HAD-IA family hydrolase [Palleronia caenipelagi]TRD21492.1 HAD-IA family hydrolase [Palleronia caenipelagi]